MSSELEIEAHKAAKLVSAPQAEFKAETPIEDVDIDNTRVFRPKAPIVGRVVQNLGEGTETTRWRLKEKDTSNEYLCLRLPVHPKLQIRQPPVALDFFGHDQHEVTVTYSYRQGNTLYGAKLDERRVPAHGQPLLGTKSPLASRVFAAIHPPQEPIKDQQVILEKINLTADFLPVRFLYEGAIKARAVVRIYTPTSLGTGFLVAPGYIMTNNHVLPTFDIATNSIAEFFYEEGEKVVRIALVPKDCYITSPDLDFTIVAIEVNSAISGVKHITLSRNSNVIVASEPVNIIQHPSGRKKEIAIHNNKVTKILDIVIKYETDTEPGSSGSPVFNNDWELVALHHSGESFGNGRAENEGIRIPPIIQYLLEKKTVPGVSKLLTFIDQFSPNAGAFGFAGLPEDASKNESELRAFTGSSLYADVGFWNIENLNNSNSAPERVEKIAKIIFDLRLDVLGLVEVETRALQKVVTALGRKGASYNYVYYDAPGGDQDLALFYDTNTTRVEDKTAEFHQTYSAELNGVVTTNDHGHQKTQSIFPRKPLFARVTVDEGIAPIEFIAVVVHLKAMGDSASKLRRKASLEALARIFDDLKSKGFSVLCGGDYNEPDPNVLENIFDVNILTTDDTRAGNASWVGSISSAPNGSQLDHIVVTDNLKVLDKGTINDVSDLRLDQVIPDYDSISDHVPVVLRLIYN